MDNSLFDAEEEEDKENIMKDSHKNITLERKMKIGSTPHRSINKNTSKTNNIEDFNDLSEERQIKYRKLIEKSKELTEDGLIKEAANLLRKAYDIFQSDKISRRIEKFETYLRDNDSSSENEENNEMVDMSKGYYLYKGVHEKLYDHQKRGILFLWKLHRNNSGGILADDMGLGKTIQIIGFLAGLYDMEKIKSVLLVMPLSLIANWQKEIDQWAPGLNTYTYHGSSKRDKLNALRRVQKRSGILITTYGTVQTSWEDLGADSHNRKFTWDYLILDEGHKIKNHTNKTSKGIRTIPARHRIILTGTPVQNNIKEMWSLFDFTHEGALLGTQKTFKMEYENPICRAREKDASVGEKRLGEEMAVSLRNLIQPYILRRTKDEIKKSKTIEAAKKNDLNTSPEMPDLTRKNELIIWCYLSQEQIKIYDDFLHQDEVKELLTSKRSPLVALTLLKKICDHPRLLNALACRKLGLDNSTIGADQSRGDDDESHLQAMGPDISKVSDAKLVNEAGKMTFLMSLIDQLITEGSRVLVFSQSRKILDIVQRLLGNKRIRVVRMDGTISQIEEREKIINKFQKDSTISVFLLTTQVGGVGLTLTSADRVVIYDPAWNPATDAQAVDRVFRIGQTKNVVIYRLITCGTVEEKIYRRQVFKSSLTRQTVEEEKNPIRYFTKTELKDLFNLDDPTQSTTQIQLERMHAKDRKTDCHLDAHIAFLLSLNIFGISDHDLMFDENGRQNEDDDEDHEEGTYPSGMAAMHPGGPGGEQAYIRQRVQRAQEAIQRESNVHGDLGSDAVMIQAAADLKNPNFWHRKEQTATKEWQTDPSVKVDLIVLDESASDEENHSAGRGNAPVTPLLSSTMIHGPPGDKDLGDGVDLDFSQIEAIEDDDVLQRTLEESLNESQRMEKVERQEEEMLKRAIEASLAEAKVEDFKVPQDLKSKQDIKFILPSTDQIKKGDGTTRVDKRQTLFGTVNNDGIVKEGSDEDDGDDTEIMDDDENSKGSSGKVMVNDSVSINESVQQKSASRAEIVADSFDEGSPRTPSPPNKRNLSSVDTPDANSMRRKSIKINPAAGDSIAEEGGQREVVFDKPEIDLDESEGPKIRKGGNARNRIVSDDDDETSDRGRDDAAVEEKRTISTEKRRRSWMPKPKEEESNTDDEDIVREVASIVEEEDEVEGGGDGSGEEVDENVDPDEDAPDELNADGSMQKSHYISSEGSDQDDEDPSEEEDENDEDASEEEDDDAEERYQQYCEDAKNSYRAKDYSSALELAQKAFKMFHDEGLEKFIARIKAKM